MHPSIQARPARVAAICAIAVGLASCGGGDNGHQQQTSANPTKVSVERVQLKWIGGAKPWKVKLNGGGDMDPDKAETKIAAKAGPVMFIVDITGKPGTTFRNPGGLSVWTGPKLPTQSGISSPDIIGPIMAKNGKLIFIDLNQGPAVKLNYALHFDNGIPSVDPIIDNGGGHDFN